MFLGCQIDGFIWLESRGDQSNFEKTAGLPAIPNERHDRVVQPAEQQHPKLGKQISDLDVKNKSNSKKNSNATKIDKEIHNKQADPVLDPKRPL